MIIFNIIKKGILFFFWSILFYACSSGTLKIGTDEISILCMGDIMTIRNGEELLEIYGHDYPVKRIKDELQKYDFVFANLETPITERGVEFLKKPFRFRLHPENAGYLNQVKIDIVSLANNHILDFGIIGLNDTTSILDEWNILYTGAGANLKESRIPAVLKKNNVAIIFLAYNERPPVDFFATKNRRGTLPLKLKYILEDIKSHKKKDNIVLISLHWGIEHFSYPEKYQIEIAHKIIDAGADGVIGHHPHVPQGIEIYNGKPIIYSLGNAISGFYNTHYKDNIMVNLIFSGNKVEKVRVIPLAGDFEKIKSQPYILKDERAKLAINYLREISRPFKTDIKFDNDIGIIDIPRYRNY